MDVSEMMDAVEREIQVAASRTARGRRLMLDRDDIAQELRIKAMQMLDRWDAGKSQWKTYVRRHIRWWAADLVRGKAGWVDRRGKRRESDVLTREQDMVLFDLIVESSVSDVDMVDYQDLLEHASTLGRDVCIWCEHHLDGHSMAEIGRRYGISQGRVSQILSRSNFQLWHRLEALVA